MKLNFLYKSEWLACKREKSLLVKSMLIATLLAALTFSTVEVRAEKSAQTVTYSAMSAKLQTVFSVIENQTGYFFFYRKEDLNDANPVSVQFKNTNLITALETIFANQPLQFEIQANTIVLSKMKKANSSPAGKEIPKVLPVIIKGRVLNEKGEPLAGASVLIMGGRTGVTTDNKGEFAINTDTENNAVLSISFVGFKPVNEPVGGRTFLEITLIPDELTMNAVVVTALGISREKRSLGYAIADVKGDDLDNGGTANVVKSLDGRMSGVNFTQASTDPAGSVFITIRGATSLSLPNSTANSQPLYIIDGIPLGKTDITNKNGVDFGNLLSQLNPNDIESINILKGASAGALYGAQAGNGVIMITTKSGKGAKKGLGVSFNTSTVVDRPYNFFETQTQYGVGIRSSAGGYVAGGAYDWGPKLDGSFNINRWNTLTQSNESVPFLATKENRLKEFMEVGYTSNYNVSVTGNSDKGSLRFSVGKMHNKGILPNNATDRMTFNLNTSYNITDKLKISVSSNYVSQYSPNKTSANNNVVELLTFSFLSHFQPVKEMKNLWLQGYDGIRQNSPQYKSNGDPYIDNPYMYTHGEINTFRKDNFFAKTELNWKLAAPLQLLIRSGMDYNGDNYEYKLSKGWESNDRRDGAYAVQTTSGLSVTSDVMLIWNKDFGKISTSATAGYNFVYGNSYDNSARANKLVRANDYSLGNAVAGTLTASNSWGIGKTQSQYLATQIGYNYQLYLDLSGRFDQGGILEEDKNSHFYPSASLSWIASESFKLPSFINFLKLRAGIAQVGHGIGRPRSTNTFSFNPVDYGATKILNIGGQLVDPHIKPEITNSYEGGFDVTLANKRISAEFTIFNKTHQNQQDYIPTSPGIGYSGMLTNVGTVESKGAEIGLTFIPIKNENWNWSFTTYYTKSSAHITKLSKTYVPNGYTFYNNGPNVTIRMAEGDKIGTMWESNVFERMPSTSKYAGMLILDDTGSWKYSTNEKDRKSIGNYNPDFILGFNSSVRYKAFKLSVVASFRVGGEYVSNITRRSVTNGHSLLTIGDKVNGPNEYTVGGRDAESGGLPWPNAAEMKYPYMKALVQNYKNYGAYAQDATYAQGVWLKPGGDPKNDADYLVNGADPLATFYYLPGLILGAQYWSFGQTLTQDATNLKVKEVVLEYSIPSGFLRKYKLQNLTVGFVGRNIFQWIKSGEKADPEAAFEGIGVNQGIIGKAWPSIASYGFNLSVNF